MNKGRPLPTVVAEILETARTKRDVVVPNSALRMDGEKNTLVWDTDYATPSQHTHGQMADYLGIPRRFYDRLRSEAPGLITANVNGLLERKPDDRRLVRTLNGQARAYLSDRYRLGLDNVDMAEALLPLVTDPTNQYEVKSIEVTENKFYLQVVTPRIEGEIRKGDPVQFGWIASNSEIGLGGWNLTPLLYRLACTNGMIIAEQASRRAHIGGRLVGDADGGFLVMSSEAQEATDKAAHLQLRDMVGQLSGAAGFQSLIDSFRERADDKIEKDPIKAIEVLGNRYSLVEDEKTSILYSFLGNNDHTRWGMANAVTEQANEMPNYDRAMRLQAVGGEVMALAGNEWRELAHA
jgi:hypothetical protein